MRYFITQRNWGGASKSNASSQGGQKSVQGNLDSEFLSFLEDELYAVAAAFFAKYFALFSLFICINIFSSSVRLSFMSVTFPVPMVPPWSLIVKCCPSSRTIGFSSLRCMVASSPGIAISFPSSSTKAAQSHVFEKHTSCISFVQGFFLPPSSGVIRYTCATNWSHAFTDFGLTTHIPLETS